jgi:hypothetical protein
MPSKATVPEPFPAMAGTGSLAHRRHLSPAELEIVGRFARALGDGTYRSTAAAAPDCAAALEDLCKKDPSLSKLRLVTVRRAIQRQARIQGLGWRTSFWSQEEQGLADDYARAVILGRFPDIRAAASECRERIRKELGTDRGRDAVCSHIAAGMRRLGIPKREQDWTEDDLRVLRRYTEMAYSGRPNTVVAMAQACSRALGGRRSPNACRIQMKKLVAEFNQPRFRGFNLDCEKKYFERYARAAHAGKYPSKMDAARDCLAALKKRQWESSRRARGRFSPAYRRNLTGVYAGIRKAWRRIGLPLMERRFWTEEEDRLFRRWHMWAWRWRRAGMESPFTQAADGLQKALAEQGYKRTFSACYNRVGKAGPPD